MKNDSLFNQGMKPAVLSKKNKESGVKEWTREGFNVSYQKNELTKEGVDKGNFFTLQFSYTFEHSNDTVYFAHCFPYTHTELQTLLSSLTTANPAGFSQIVSKKTLCNTLGNIPCDVLTVTAPQPQKPLMNLDLQKMPKKKDVVIILARQHPGETPGSWMMEGVIQYVCSLTNEDATYLREKCIFKIIPMVNPDGVIQGNYRTDLSGVDLNRHWLRPSKEQLPVVNAIKQMISSLAIEHNIKYIIDLHGHSKKMNVFFYGNSRADDQVGPRVFSLACSEDNQHIDFESCSFRMQASKASTARIALFNLLQNVNSFPTIPLTSASSAQPQGQSQVSGGSVPPLIQRTEILTLEASFFGYKNRSGVCSFTIEDYRGIGATLCRVLSLVLRQEEECMLSFDADKLKGNIIDFDSYKKMNVYERLFRNFKCDAQNLIKVSVQHDETVAKKEQLDGEQADADAADDAVSSGGSDSDPEADELSVAEVTSLDAGFKAIRKQKLQQASIQRARIGTGAAYRGIRASNRARADESSEKPAGTPATTANLGTNKRRNLSQLQPNSAIQANQIVQTELSYLSMHQVCVCSSQNQNSREPSNVNFQDLRRGSVKESIPNQYPIGTTSGMMEVLPSIAPVGTANLSELLKTKKYETNPLVNHRKLQSTNKVYYSKPQKFMMFSASGNNNNTHNNHNNNNNNNNMSNSVNNSIDDQKKAAAIKQAMLLQPLDFSVGSLIAAMTHAVEPATGQTNGNGLVNTVAISGQAKPNNFLRVINYPIVLENTTNNPNGNNIPNNANSNNYGSQNNNELQQQQQQYKGSGCKPGISCNCVCTDRQKQVTARLERRKNNVNSTQSALIGSIGPASVLQQQQAQGMMVTGNAKNNICTCCSCQTENTASASKIAVIYHQVTQIPGATAGAGTRNGGLKFVDAGTQSKFSVEPNNQEPTSGIEQGEGEAFQRSSNNNIEDNICSICLKRRVSLKYIAEPGEQYSQVGIAIYNENARQKNGGSYSIHQNNLDNMSLSTKDLDVSSKDISGNNNNDGIGAEKEQSNHFDDFNCSAISISGGQMNFHQRSPPILQVLPAVKTNQSQQLHLQQQQLKTAAAVSAAKKHNKLKRSLFQKASFSMHVQSNTKKLNESSNALELSPAFISLTKRQMLPSTDLAMLQKPLSEKQPQHIIAEMNERINQFSGSGSDSNNASQQQQHPLQANLQDGSSSSRDSRQFQPFNTNGQGFQRGRISQVDGNSSFVIGGNVDGDTNYSSGTMSNSSNTRQQFSIATMSSASKGATSSMITTPAKQAHQLRDAFCLPKKSQSLHQRNISAERGEPFSQIPGSFNNNSNSSSSNNNNNNNFNISNHDNSALNSPLFLQQQHRNRRAQMSGSDYSNQGNPNLDAVISAELKAQQLKAQQQQQQQNAATEAKNNNQALLFPKKQGYSHKNQGGHFGAFEGYQVKQSAKSTMYKLTMAGLDFCDSRLAQNQSMVDGSDKKVGVPAAKKANITSNHEDDIAIQVSRRINAIGGPSELSTGLKQKSRKTYTAPFNQRFLESIFT